MRAGRPFRASRLAVMLGLVSVIVSMMAISASASHEDLEITIPVNTVVHAPVGSTTLLATADVPDGFAGHECEVRAHTENQNSTHPDNDLLVESGTSQVIIPDVEADPGEIIEVDEMLVLGNVITVSLIMGPDHTFSAGILVVIECEADDTTTTTVDISSTSEATSTTVEVGDSTLETTTSVAPSTSIDDEVLGTEVLPFTGSGESNIAILGLALLAGGALLVVGIRSRSDS